MQFSVIIPTYNEAENIERLIRRLNESQSASLQEILVVDASSIDNTAQLAKNAGAKVLVAEKKGRTHQLIQGAKAANGELLYFVHGDTLPPTSFKSDILAAIQNGYPMGCFRFQFESDKKALRFNSFMTRFGMLISRGGDQSLFITRAQYDALEGFRADFPFMEDFEFIARAKRQRVPFKVIKNEILVSARKYEKNSWLRVQLANLTVFTLFNLGLSPQKLENIYKRLLIYP